MELLRPVGKKGWLAVLLLLWLFMPGGAAAAKEEGFSLSPLVFEVHLAAGEKTEGQLTVTNTGSSCLSFQVYSEDMPPSCEEKNQPAGQYLDLTAQESISDWIQITPKKFSLAANERQDITFVIEVPKTAQTGSRPGFLYVKTAKDGDKTVIASQIGMILYLSVGEEETHGGGITRFSPARWWMPRRLFTGELKNTGSVHLAAEGEIRVYRRGEEVDRLPLDRIILQPQRARTIEIPWEKKTSPGRHEAVLMVRFAGQEEKYMTADFWVLPGPFLLGVVLWGAAFYLWKTSSKKPQPYDKREKR